TDHGSQNAFLVEGARVTPRHTLYTRFELLQVGALLLQPLLHPQPSIDAAHAEPPVAAFTLGAVRSVGSWRGLEGGIGADATFYGVPALLQPSYSAHPVSFHVFFRVRPPAGSMGRMWNMRMSQPMSGHGM
ncbi:MAG: hypothetical protein JF610_16190, partial [Acidobacteria bacterium]|nr:hypothetical protein [Acidobacteriota bacterium]